MKNQLPATPRRPAICKQSGVVAVEFALSAALFFLLVFAIIELCRIMYMYNTLAEVTRNAASAAAKIDFHDTSALNVVRQHAVFRQSSGTLPFGDPITDQNISIDYLSLTKQGNTVTMTPLSSGALPACPARNRQNCLANQYGPSCIRLVRVRVCASGTSGQTCQAVPYQMLFPITKLNVRLPTSTTIVQAESLGYKEGDALCN
jgi:Flp pilus assembly protein TadG